MIAAGHSPNGANDSTISAPLPNAIDAGTIHARFFFNKDIGDSGLI